MFFVNLGRSSTYSPNFVDVDPGLMARILKVSGRKDNPQGNRVQLVVDTLHARRNQDWYPRACNHVSALRSAQVLRGLAQEVARLDIGNHHAVRVTSHRVCNALGLGRRPQ